MSIHHMYLHRLRRAREHTSRMLAPRTARTEPVRLLLLVLWALLLVVMLLSSPSCSSARARTYIVPKRIMSIPRRRARNCLVLVLVLERTRSGRIISGGISISLSIILCRILIVVVLRVRLSVMRGRLLGVRVGEEIRYGYGLSLSSSGHDGRRIRIVDGSCSCIRR